MNRAFPTLLVLLLALVSVPVAEAGPIVYFDSYRSFNDNGAVQDTTATGAWSARAPTSINRSQNSVIGAQLVDPQGHPFEMIRAFGTLNTRLRDGAAYYSTDLFTSFELDNPYHINLDVGLTARSDARVEGYLFDQNTQTMLAQLMLDHATGRLRFDGVVEPGVYSYFLFAE